MCLHIAITYFHIHIMQYPVNPHFSGSSKWTASFMIASVGCICNQFWLLTLPCTKASSLSKFFFLGLKSVYFRDSFLLQIIPEKFPVSDDSFFETLHVPAPQTAHPYPLHRPKSIIRRIFITSIWCSIINTVLPASVSLAKQAKGNVFKRRPVVGSSSKCKYDRAAPCKLSSQFHPLRLTTR